MHFRLPIEVESDVRRLWHRIVGILVLTASSVLTVFAVEWLTLP